jgi:hypothetical protein
MVRVKIAGLTRRERQTEREGTEQTQARRASRE